MIKFTCCISFLLMVLLISGCEKSINPISPKGTEYAVYGSLNIGQSANYIRVHNTNSLLNPESTRELDLNMRLTNLETGESDLLIDNLVKFNNIYTHNYQTDLPINYDTRYKVFWEDGDGFQGSLITKTTKKSEMTTYPDTVNCKDRFFIELTNINLEVGEQMDVEVGINVGNKWYWTFQQDYYSYDAENQVLVLGWSPQMISKMIFCGLACIYQSAPPCSSFTNNKVRFKFHHIGYMDGNEIPQQINLNDPSALPEQQQIVLSRYGGEAEFTIADEEFEE